MCCKLGFDFSGLLMDMGSLTDNMGLMQKYFYWILDGKLAGSPGPDAVEWDLNWLWDAGIRAILSLNEGGVDAKALKVKGFKHAFILVPDNIPPQEEDCLEFEKRLPEQIKFIDECLSNGLPTLVHCHAGMDRTGTIASSYLVLKRSYGAESALAHLRKCNPYAVSSEGFEALYFRLVKTLRT